jgi:hypothetical protein
MLPVSAQRIHSARPENSRLAKAQTSFASVRAVSASGGVYVEWTMEAESNNLGFFVYKKGKGGPTLLNGERVVPGTALRIGDDTYFGERYSYFDRTGVPGETYFVESINMDGRRSTSRAVMAEFSTDLKTASAASLTGANTASAVEATNSLIELRRLTPGRELSSEIKTGAHKVDAAGHASAISQPGVRIGVKKEGFYRVAREQLEAGGFDGGTDPSLWQLYLEGTEQAINVHPNGDYIEFYGKGIDTSDTDTQMYYLIVGNSPGKRIASIAAQPIGSETFSPGYMQAYTLKERKTFTETVINGAAENYFGRTLAPNNTVTLPVTLSGIDPSGPNVTIDIKLQGVNVTNHIVEVSVNGIALGQIKYSFIRPFSATYSVPAASLVDGVNNIQFRATGANDFNWFDSVTVWYQRRFISENNAFGFYTKDQEASRLEGFSSSNIRVFDVTDADAPAAITGISPYANGSTWSVDLPGTAPRVMFAVEDSGLLSSVSVTPINTSVLRTPTHEANLIIISHKDFLAEAETWANYRRGQGVKVVVAEITDVYDEFAYGRQGPDAIENFLKYAFNSYQTPPQYVLLIGDATYDPRNYEGKLNNNLVPTRFVDAIYSTVPSDESMADFNKDGLSEVAIGRIPAQKEQDVTIAFNKVVTWEASLANSLSRGALFAHDQKDATGLDFEAISLEFAAELPASMPKTQLSKTEIDSTNLLVSQINSGKYLVNYEGHGLATSWANGFFSSANVPSLTNAGQESIFLMLTCYNGAFARVGSSTSDGFDYYDSLGETLIKHPTGGAVASWSSPGKTTLDVHEVMGKRFFQQLGAGNINRLGDLIRDAKATLNAGPDVRFGWVLLGDPMLRTQ